MGIFKMDIDRGKVGVRNDVGCEVPGTISIYTLQFEDGTYFAGYRDDDSAHVLVADNWPDAEMRFGFNGLLSLDAVKKRYGGTIMIQSTTAPKPYYKQTFN